MTELNQPAPGGRGAAIVFLVVQALAAAVFAFLGIMLVFVSDSCGTTTCNTNLIVVGMAITGLVPIGLWVVSLVHLIVRIRRQQSVWWVPLVWLVVSGLVALGGILTAFQGGPDTFF